MVTNVTAAILIDLQNLREIVRQEFTVLDRERAALLLEIDERIMLLESELLTLDQIEEYIMGLVVVLPDVTGTFVATDGNDSTGTGSVGSPYRTVTAARDKIRLDNNVTPILMKTGAYFLDGTKIDFTSEDNGLTIQPAPGAAPVIHQGEEVTGSWSDEGGGLWSKAWSNACEDLFIDGTRARRSQFPAWDAGNPYEDIYLTMETGVAGPSGGQFTFTHRPDDDFPNLTDLTGVKILYQSNTGGYSWEVANVDAYNSGTRTITIEDMGTNYDPRDGGRYFIFDIPKQASKALTPGEFWYDDGGNKIWYMDSGFVGDGSEQVTAGQGIVVFNITGDGITVKDLALTSASGINSASVTYGWNIFTARCFITINGGDNNLVTGCDLSNGAGGVGIYSTATGNTVTLSTIANMYGCGVGVLSGSDNCIASENLIHDIGQYYHRDKGIEWSDVLAFTVVHNDIHTCPGSAIFGTADNDSESINGFVIEYNDILDVGMETADVGGIYIRGKRDSAAIKDQNGLIRYNSVVNMRSRNTKTDGSYTHFETGFGSFNQGISTGIYLDDEASGNDVYGNFIKDTGHAWMIHGGYGNLVRENYCVNCSGVNHDEDKTGAWAGNDWNEYRNNVIYFEAAADQPAQMLVAMQYVHKYTSPDRTPVMHYDNNNYYFEDGFPAEFARLGWTGPTDTFATWKTFLASAHADDTGSITTDPEFTNPAGDVWSLQVTSPALDPPVSIAQIPFSSIGRSAP